MRDTANTPTPALPRAFPLRSTWQTVRGQESSFLLHVLLTEACNLDCSYCYQNKQPQRPLDLSLMEERMRQQIRQRPEDRKLAIRFFGGEPLLCFDGLRFLKDSAERYWSELGRPPERLVFGLSTNGTLLDEDMKAWFQGQPNLRPSLSLDGTPELHNANRSDSYAAIAPHLPFFQQYNEPVKMTIGPASIGRVADGIRHIHALGFECHANLAFERTWQHEADRRQQLRDFAADLARLVEFYRSNTALKRTTLLLPMPATLPGDPNHPQTPTLSCGMGTRMVALDTNGDLWPCDRVAPMMQGETTDWNFSRTQVAPEKCACCPFQPSCPECRAANWEENGHLDHKTTHHCEFTQLQLRASALLSLSDLVAWQKENPVVHLPEEEKDLLANRLAVAQRVVDLTQGLWQYVVKGEGVDDPII